LNRKIVVRPEAEAELADAFDWYEHHVPGLGADFLLCADDVFNSIAQSPQQYPLIYKDVRRALTRRFPYGIFFVADDFNVVVLAVFHASRNPQHWKKRV
jgi:plasmid stabilization system protein ParE